MHGALMMAVGHHGELFLNVGLFFHVFISVLKSEAAHSDLFDTDFAT